MTKKPKSKKSSYTRGARKPAPVKIRRTAPRPTTYRSYLLSSAWREKRMVVLARDRGRCVCGAVASDVHHKTYDRIFNEQLEDLLAVCRPCHDEIHEIRTRDKLTLEQATSQVLYGRY